MRQNKQYNFKSTPSHNKSMFEVVYDHLAYHHYDKFYELFSASSPKLQAQYLELKHKTTGFTLLQCAFDKNCSLEAIEFLFDKNTNLTLLTPYNESLFYLAKKHTGSLDIRVLSLLLKNLKNQNIELENYDQVALMATHNWLRQREDAKPLELYSNFLNELFEQIPKASVCSSCVRLCISLCLSYESEKSFELLQELFDNNYLLQIDKENLLLACIHENKKESFNWLLANINLTQSTRLNQIIEIASTKEESYYLGILEVHLSKQSLQQQILQIKTKPGSKEAFKI